MSKSVGEKIKEMRLSRGMTLEELGNRVGVGKSTVRKWETGMIANMKRDKIEKLADALDIPVWELMEWKRPSELDISKTFVSPISNDKKFVIDFVTHANNKEVKRLQRYIKLLQEEKEDDLL